MQKPEEQNLLRDACYAKSNSSIDIRQHMLTLINIYYLIKNMLNYTISVEIFLENIITNGTNDCAVKNGSLYFKRLNLK